MDHGIDSETEGGRASAVRVVDGWAGGRRFGSDYFVVEEEEEVLRGMGVGGWEEGRRTDGRSWGLGICLLRARFSILSLTGTCTFSTINYYQICRNCCAWFQPSGCRRGD